MKANYSRYFNILNKLIETLSQPKQIKEAKKEENLEIFSKFIRGIPINTIAVFDFLLEINKYQEEKENSLKEMSTYLQIFTNHVKNSIDNTDP